MSIEHKININDPENTALIKLFIEGDETAFDRLVLKYKDMVFNLCYRLLGDYDDADDAAQDVFIRIYKYLKGFQFKSTFSTWIYRIAVNTCKNRISSKAYHISRSTLKIDKSKNDEKKIEIKNGGLTPPETLERKDMQAMLEKILNMLPVKQKLTVVLRDIENKSYEEISDITGMKAGTVKSSLARGRERICELVKGEIKNGL